jgi:acetyl esterase/lipase
MKSVSRLLALASICMTVQAQAQAQPQPQPQTYGVTMQTGVPFVEHDGVKLAGDLYLPKGRDKAPVVIAVHGGGWQIGNPKFYQHWGPHLAKNGYAVFAVSYRLSKPGAKTFPGAVYDVKSAIQFVRANAAQLGVDPDRIALMGDSAGAHLVSLTALAGDEPLFSSEYRSDPHAATPANVKAVVGFYGVYDMQAQWLHDQIARPRDQITEKFLGVSPMQSRRTYFDASPVSYATVEKNEKTRTRFLLLHGTHDDIVDPQTQSQAFLAALKQAGFFVRTIVVPGAGHFWSVDPIEEPGSYGAQVAPQMLRFLRDGL